MHKILGIISFTLLCLVLFSFSQKNRKNSKYLGQNCPPDMEFIPGNSNISSFFIGKSEETNLNYVVYTDWTERVFIDYPQILEDIKPHDVEYGDLSKFNDPLLQPQLRNPAFAYYPVTGCTWVQIQNYLSWKTDRLNEDILFQKGYYRGINEQFDSDNFNTEAVLAGQYEGQIKTKLPGSEDFERHLLKEREMGKFLPFLFTGYRLPTEEEWEYAAQADFKNKSIGHNNKYPCGKKYFLFDFVTAQVPELNEEEDDTTKKKPSVLVEKTPLFSYVENAGGYESRDLNRIKGANTYNTKYRGIFNMGDNVEEWTMDEYSPAMRHFSTPESIFAANGFKMVSDNMYKNQDGFLIEKDSMGRLPYRVMGYRANGNEMKITRYKYSSNNVGLRTPADTVTRYRVVKTGSWKNPSTTARKKMKETDASANVGFRAVIQYYGMPIDKTKMVDWK